MSFNYLVYVNDQIPIAWEESTLENAVAALNKEQPIWGGAVLVRDTAPGTDRWVGAGVELCDRCDVYVIEEEHSHG